MRQKYLIIDNDFFFAKEQRYRIITIDKVYFFYVQTQKTINFVAAGIDYDVIVGLYLIDKPGPLVFRSRALFSGSGKRSSEALIAKFNYLCSRTYLLRKSRYLAHLVNDGFFTYDGKRIYDNGDVVSERWKFNLRNDRPILRSPFVIFYERKRDGGVFRRAEKCEIQTRFDSDVFFGILADTFQLKWT